MCFSKINPLNVQLKPICHLLALLGAHPIPHVSRIRVNTGKSLECKINVICISLVQLLLFYRNIKYNFIYFFKCGLSDSCIKYWQN